MAVRQNNQTGEFETDASNEVCTDQEAFQIINNHNNILIKVLDFVSDKNSFWTNVATSLPSIINQSSFLYHYIQIIWFQ